MNTYKHTTIYIYKKKNCSEWSYTEKEEFQTIAVGKRLDSTSWKEKTGFVINGFWLSQLVPSYNSSPGSGADNIDRSLYANHLYQLLGGT